jgi:hypothetical protein
VIDLILKCILCCKSIKKPINVIDSERVIKGEFQISQTIILTALNLLLLFFCNGAMQCVVFFCSEIFPSSKENIKVYNFFGFMIKNDFISHCIKSKKKNEKCKKIFSFLFYLVVLNGIIFD